MLPDRLDALLRRFSVEAGLFHAGPLCGIHDFEPQPGVGQLHLVRRGEVRIQHAGLPDCVVREPSLLFYPRPLAHRFDTDEQAGAELACAHIRFERGSTNPLVASLPGFLALPLSELHDTGAILESLFDEAFGARCGRQAVVNRLFEVVLVRILRHLMSAPGLERGLLAGLARPQLARALVAMHAEPAREWSLPALAAEAAMSRSSFAESFRATVGVSPGDYLAGWRIDLAQDALRRGEALERIAVDVGYGSSAALSRAFKARCGQSPRQWLRGRLAASTGERQSL